MRPGSFGGATLMAWLLRDGEVLASVDPTNSLVDLARGLARREDERAALLVTRPGIAHSIGTRRPVDVAYLDKDLVVLSTRCLPPLRVSMPCRRCRSVLLAGGGAFSRWTLRPGDRLELRD